MKSEEQKSSGQAKDEASIERLRQLTLKLCSNDITTARLAAFNLSWMQEDGLDILKTALFGNCPVPTRNAAAYGLRKMRGRMKKMALEVLQKGLIHHDTSTKEICRNALQLLGQEVPKETVPKKPPVSHLRIKEIPRKSSPRKRVVNRRTRR